MSTTQLSTMLATLLVGSCAAMAATAEGPIGVESSIDGRIFIWHVTNHSAPPIMRVSIPLYSVYDEHVPEGWEVEQTSKNMFAAQATSPAYAILLGQTQKFDVRATSAGTVLTLGSATFGFEKADDMTLAGVWVPLLESSRTYLIVPLVLIGIGLLQWRITRRARAER